LIRIILSFRNKDTAGKTAKGIKNKIRKIDHTGVDILGPAPAPIEKIKTLWRWHLILKGKNSKILRRTTSKLLDLLKDVKDLKVDIDVDPVNMM